MRRAVRPNNLFTVFGGIMSSDNQLQQAVLAELKWEPSVTAAHIGVAANAGVVTLSGHVGSFAEKLAAEATARRVKGVKALAEEIEVRLPFATKKTDEEIAAAALGRLAWDVSVPNDAVKVKVEKGRITLTGQVDWQYQRQAAEHDVRGELTAHVAAERPVHLAAHLGDLRVPAARDELPGALHDAIEVDEQVKSEDRDDERAEDDREVAERAEKGHARGAHEVRKLLAKLAL